jgi:protein-disulfide isomerase
MPRVSQLLFVFIPAILIVGLALYIRVVQYEPQFPAYETTQEERETTIPVLPDDPILGERTAPLTVIVFEDFGCESCRAQFGIFTDILETYPRQVKFVWKGLPVTTFPVSSRDAHEYAACANQQGKFEPFAQYAFANNQNLTIETLQIIADELKLNNQQFETCLNTSAGESHIQKTELLARKLNIQSVPTVFINNVQAQSPQTFAGWLGLLGLQTPPE